MLTEKSRLWEFMKHEPTRRVIMNRVPELTSQPNLTFVFKNMTLEQYARYSIDRLDEAWIYDVLRGRRLRLILRRLRNRLHLRKKRCIRIIIGMRRAVLPLFSDPRRSECGIYAN